MVKRHDDKQWGITFEGERWCTGLIHLLEVVAAASEAGGILPWALKHWRGIFEKTSRRETLAMESKPYKGWGFAAVSSFCCCTNLWGWWSGHIDSSSRNRLGRFCKNFKYICIIITLSWTSVVSLLIAGLVSLVGQFDRKNGGASIYSQGCVKVMSWPITTQ